MTAAAETVEVVASAINTLSDNESRQSSLEGGRAQQARDLRRSSGGAFDPSVPGNPIHSVSNYLSQVAEKHASETAGVSSYISENIQDLESLGEPGMGGWQEDCEELLKRAKGMDLEGHVRRAEAAGAMILAVGESEFAANNLLQYIWHTARVRESADSFYASLSRANASLSLRIDEILSTGFSDQVGSATTSDWTAAFAISSMTTPFPVPAYPLTHDTPSISNLLTRTANIMEDAAAQLGALDEGFSGAGSILREIAKVLELVVGGGTSGVVKAALTSKALAAASRARSMAVAARRLSQMIGRAQKLKEQVDWANEPR